MGRVTETASTGTPGPDLLERARQVASPVVTTTLVHRRTRGPVPWWQDAVVHRIPPSDLSGLETMSAHISHVARLGADTLQIRPVGVDPREPGSVRTLRELVRRTHQRSLRVIVEVPLAGALDAREHLTLCRGWLELGADGIDLADVRAEGGPEAFTALHGLVGEHDEAVLTGALHAGDLDVAARLLEDWLHVTRDDRLVTTPWDSAEMRATISDAYLQRDPVGAPAAWTLSPRAATGELGETVAAAWEAPTPAALRARVRAVGLFMCALPGAVYLRLGEAVDVVPPRGPTGVEEVAGRAAAQRGVPGSMFEHYRLTLRLRHELGLGAGPLAWVDDAPEGTLAAVNGSLMAMVNLGGEPLAFATESELLHATPGVPRPVDGTVVLPPDSTVWLGLS